MTERPATPPHRFPELVVAGPPLALGQAIGEGAREAVRAFVAHTRERAHAAAGVTREQADRLVGDCVGRLAGYDPDQLTELRGIAAGAGVTLEDVMLLQVRNQLQPVPDSACTSIGLAADPVSGRGRLAAQNWDNDPELDPFTVVLTRRPAGGRTVMTVGQAGLIAYIGFSEDGIGACLNSLPYPSRPYGVPHYSTLRAMYAAGTLDGAVAALERADRAIPANILLTTPSGPADLEVTPDEVRVLHPEGSTGVILHTNHCVHPALAATGATFPELMASRHRLERAGALAAGRGAADVDPEAILADHEGAPRSICSHPDDDPVSGTWRTVMSVIIEPDERRLRISRGNPCVRPYEVYRLGVA